MKKEWTPDEQKKHREIWCEWLESGNYAQVRKALKDYVRTGELGYCCLGIGCLVYKEVTGEGEWVDVDCDSAFRAGVLEDDQRAEKQEQYDQSDTGLPLAVKDFFGLESTHGAYQEYQGETLENKSTSLVWLNDRNGYDFKAIAKVIREEPPGLIRQSKEEAIT